MVAALTLPSSLVRLVKAKASASPASSTTTATSARSARASSGVGARRVRAGAPHSRHQSCSGATLAPQRGQRSGTGGARGVRGTLVAHQGSGCSRGASGSPLVRPVVAAAVGAGERVRLGGLVGRRGSSAWARARAAGGGSGSGGAGGGGLPASAPETGVVPARSTLSGSGLLGGVERGGARHASSPDAADLDHRQRPAELRAALRAEARVAAVQGAAARTGGDAGLAQLDDVAALVEHALDRAQLAVDGVERGELAEHELVVAAREAMEVEGEAAEVAEAELADTAQVAQAAPQPAAVAEAGPGRWRRPRARDRREAVRPAAPAGAPRSSAATPAGSGRADAGWSGCGGGDPS